MSAFRTLLLVCLVLAGCATSGKKEIPAETVKRIEETRTRLLAKGAGVVGDACIVNLGATGTVAYREPSLAYLKASSDTFSSFLAHQGIAVHQIAMPLLCGAATGSTSTLMVADHDGAAATTLDLPIRAENKMTLDGNLARAYAELLAQVDRAPPTDPNLPFTITEIPVVLAPDQVQALFKDLRSPLAFVVSVGGGQVSGMRKALTVAATGLISGLISNGTTISVGLPLSATYHSLALVDLERQTLLWKVRTFLPKVDPVEAADSEAHVELWDGALFGTFLPDRPIVNAVTPLATQGTRSPLTPPNDGTRRLASMVLVPVAAPSQLYADNRAKPWADRIWARMTDETESRRLYETFSSKYAGYRLQAGKRLTEALHRELQRQGFTVRVASPDEVKRNRDQEIRLRNFRGHDAVLDFQIYDFAMYAQPKDPSFRPIIRSSAVMLNPQAKEQTLLEASYRYGTSPQDDGEHQIPVDDRFAFRSITDLLDRSGLVEEAFDEGLRKIAQKVATDVGQQFRPLVPPAVRSVSAASIATTKLRDGAKTATTPLRRIAGPVLATRQPRTPVAD